MMIGEPQRSCFVNGMIKSMKAGGDVMDDGMAERGSFMD
jgi:hypothetical protein